MNSQRRRAPRGAPSRQVSVRNSNRRVKVASMRANTAKPLQLATSIRLHHVFRFINTGVTTSISVKYDDLLSLWVVATGATTGYTLFNAVRMRKVELWGPMTSTLIPVTATLDWAGTTTGASGTNLKLSDTSMGSFASAHISSLAPKTAQASQWQPSGNGTAFTLSVPSNSIIDVHVSYGVIDDGTAGSTVSLTGATTGANYFRPLDAGGNYVPVGYPTA